MVEHIIPSGVAALPLERYIQRAWPLLPGWALRDAFKRRDVKVNGARQGRDFPVRGGDALQLYIEDKLLAQPLETVYDDGRLVACVKPQGLPVDVDRGEIGADTLLTRLRAVHPDAALAHRLDAGTGGIVLAGADPETLEALLQCFQQHRLRKRYIAVVAGDLPQREGVYCDHLVKDARQSLVRVTAQPVRGRSKPIETRWQMLATLPNGLKRVALEPVTGRTHQLRAHMAFHGQPILGDDKYGDRALNRRHPQKYPCLWCEALTLEGGAGLEPYAGQTFSAPAPDWKL